MNDDIIWWGPHTIIAIPKFAVARVYLTQHLLHVCIHPSVIYSHHQSVVSTFGRHIGRTILNLFRIISGFCSPTGILQRNFGHWYTHVIKSIIAPSHPFVWSASAWDFFSCLWIHVIEPIKLWTTEEFVLYRFGRTYIAWESSRSWRVLT